MSSEPATSSRAVCRLSSDVANYSNPTINQNQPLVLRTASPSARHASSTTTNIMLIDQCDGLAYYSDQSWNASELTSACPARAAPRKTIYRGPRLIYAAGLEHTGHHIWHSRIFPLLDRHGFAHLHPSVVPNLQAELSTNPCCVGEPAAVANITARLMDTWTRFGHGAPTAFLDSCSWPCYSAPPVRPNLLRLARVAEDARVDLRVLYLTRPASEIMCVRQDCTYTVPTIRFPLS